MRITKRQLESLIREEYLRSTPRTRPGMRMSEARANMLAQQILDEGLLDRLKAKFSGKAAKAGAVADALGGAAAGAFDKAVDAAASMIGPAKSAYEQMMKSISSVDDEGTQNELKTIKASLENSIRSSLQKAIKDGVSDLVKTAKMEEDQAQSLVITIANGVIGGALAGGK